MLSLLLRGKVVPPPRVANSREWTCWFQQFLCTNVEFTTEGESGAATKSRTRDLLITSQLLYHG